MEIACADTANGLLHTLKSLEKYSTFNESDLMREAFKKNVTSKPSSSHMGYGLWLIKEILNRYDGHLKVFSSNYSFTSRYGKEKILRSPKWVGTIIYLSIPVKNGINIADILIENRRLDTIKPKINFSN
ncbi:hypothetical protein BTO06_09245 [Tenacibaculum sp. SZ-18]|uniref:hypothetical protein n=1 Tax=Tenacibaculum sp. SZ-18 TaxID=754423 RepID=UPI000C2D329E|nr:hypothetical protein [Tenacibaculum sp. SZ-18]AUC15314.1 hypothetical protein BTO06_09245 [Tenacibaculum sp. SZ-18]